MPQTHQATAAQNQVSIDLHRIADVDMSHVGVDTKELAKLYPNASWMFLNIDGKHVITAPIMAIHPDLILSDIKAAAQALRTGDVDLDKPGTGAAGYIDPVLECLKKVPSVSGDNERKWLSDMPFAHGVFVVDLWDTLYQLDQNYTQLLRASNYIHARLRKDPEEAKFRIDFILREGRTLSTWGVEEKQLAVCVVRKNLLKKDLHKIMQREASRFTHSTWVQYFVTTLASLSVADLIREHHVELADQRRREGYEPVEYWDSRLYAAPQKGNFIQQMRANRNKNKRWSVGTNSKIIKAYKARHQHVHS